MFANLSRAVVSKSGTAAALTDSVIVSDKIAHAKDGLVWHAPGLLLFLDAQVDVENGAEYFRHDIIMPCFSEVKLQVVKPGQPARGGALYDAFDLTGYGVRLMEALRSRILENDDELAVANNTVIKRGIYLPFGFTGWDSYAPNLIPVDAIKELSVTFDPTQKADNITWDSCGIKAYLPVVKAAVRNGDYVASSWVERTGFDDYHVDSPARRIQAAYVINSVDTDASKWAKVSSAELELNSVDGYLAMDHWIHEIGMRDVLDDGDSTRSMDFVFPLMDARVHGRNTGVMGPIRWQDPDETTASNRALFKMIDG